MTPATDRTVAAAGASTFDDCIVDVLLRHSQERPHAIALICLGDGEQESMRLTYGELGRRVRGFAAGLQARGLAGAPLAIALPHGVDYIVATLGCFFAGAIAVPMPPLAPGRSNERFAAIMRELRPAGLLAEPVIDAATPIGDWCPASLLAPTESNARADADAWVKPPLASGAVAFLQYTSGSTAAPKGVIVTHGNLAANRAMIRAAFALEGDWRCVTWLPLHHDMGLVGGILQPLSAGVTVVVLPPLAVVQKPVRWLAAISRYRATVSGGPCFAYEACVERVSRTDRIGLDLSAWRLAFCGAEPVRAEVLERFAEAYAPCGFDASALYPCYGLAEATLLVAGGTAGAGRRDLIVDPTVLRNERRASPADDPGAGIRITACGRTWLDQAIMIADPETGAAVPERHVGEIRITGPNVTAGYWNNREATRASFPTVLREGRPQRELRTGDLGLIDQGELFVLGRLKDVIIVRGTKHHAEDVERAAHEAHAALADGAGVAFAADRDGREELIVCHEVGRSWLATADPTAIAAAISARVLALCGVRPHLVLLLRPGSVPRTSSGKVQRQSCRSAYGREDWPAERMLVRDRRPATARQRLGAD